MRRGLITVLMMATFFPALSLHSQAPGGGDADTRRTFFAGMQRVSGEVTAVAGGNITVKALDGTTVQIVTTSNTRMMKAGGVPFKIVDLKAGDGVLAAGNLDEPNKTMHAAVLIATDAEQVRKFKENLGKTYIAGKVTAIDLDNAKMTVERPDGVAQTIGFDETTSFRRGHLRQGAFEGGNGNEGAPVPQAESITLADIKVGDNVGGQGSIKGGVFVPAQLTVAKPQAGIGHPHRPEPPPAGPLAPQ